MVRHLAGSLCASDLCPLFPQWTLDEIETVLSDTENEDAVLSILSARPVDDAILARILSNDTSRVQPAPTGPHAPVPPLYPVLVDPPLPAPKSRFSSRKSEKTRPLLSDC